MAQPSLPSRRRAKEPHRGASSRSSPSSRREVAPVRQRGPRGGHRRAAHRRGRSRARRIAMEEPPERDDEAIEEAAAAGALAEQPQRDAAGIRRRGEGRRRGHQSSPARPRGGRHQGGRFPGHPEHQGAANSTASPAADHAALYDSCLHGRPRHDRGAEASAADHDAPCASCQIGRPRRHIRWLRTERTVDCRPRCTVC